VKIYTIGHSNLDLDALIAVLKEHGISWVADVRSAPYSRRYPQFNRRPFASALNAAGIRYLFLGDKIGGKPPEGHGGDAWSQGKLNPMLVSGLSEMPRWREGIAALVSAVTTLDRGGKTGCILCSEADVSNCHRSLIAFEIEAMLPGLTVDHLRPVGPAGETTHPGRSVRAPVEAHFQKPLFIAPSQNDRSLDH